MRARCPNCDRRFTGEVDRCPFDETPLVRSLEAEPVQHEGDPPLGTLIANQYRLLEIVGEGGMGVIYRARQETVGRDVAVKLLRARFAKEESVVKRFENEARIISQLRHPNTLRLYDTQYMENGSLLIVTEFLEGQSLEELLRGGPIGVERALSIADQICASLTEAHSVGVVHRDLKPANVFLDRVGGEDLVKVLDFGIAKLTQGGMLKTQANIIMGTPAYMAPEQVRGEAADTRSDIYALGVLLYQMLAGHTPFAADNPVTLLMKQVNDAPPPFRRELAVPADLDRLIFQMLRKTPAERPERVVEVRDRLRIIARGPSGGDGHLNTGELIALDRPIRRASEDTPSIPKMNHVSDTVSEPEFFDGRLGSEVRGGAERHAGGMAGAAGRQGAGTSEFISASHPAANGAGHPSPRGVALTIPIEIDGPLESAASSKLSLFLDQGLPDHDLGRRPRRAEKSTWPVALGVLAIAAAGAGAYVWAQQRTVASTALVEPVPTQDPKAAPPPVIPAAAPAEAKATPVPPPPAAPAPPSEQADGAVAVKAEPEGAEPTAAERRSGRKKKKRRARDIDPLEAATNKILSGSGAAQDDANAEAEGGEEEVDEAPPAAAPEAEEPQPKAPSPPVEPAPSEPQTPPPSEDTPPD